MPSGTRPRDCHNRWGPGYRGSRSRLAPTYQAIVTVAYCTGWRINSELLPLEWRQSARAAGVIRLEPGTTKNRDGRLFKYGEIVELVATIDGLWARHEALAAEVS